jgi:hypothetical protein
MSSFDKLTLLLMTSESGAERLVWKDQKHCKATRRFDSKGEIERAIREAGVCSRHDRPLSPVANGAGAEAKSDKRRRSPRC